ncbi:phage tail fiber domain-containing protein [Pseudomonas sp. USHLN015]|uniref:phage tail fiber domain-containing protein n=1 Tax=Pseudomonas sp. USHLN015 TaxID=3081296 RepID=UPI00301D1751
MAVTTVYTYDLNGSKKDFDVPFEYLARRFVQVTLIGQDRKTLTLSSEFRFISKTSIQTTKAWGPADAYERIEIRRNTSTTDRLVDFADGSILRANELNISQVQTLHVAEEARNMVVDTIGADNNGNLDARGRRLVNLADAFEAGDAVTLRQEQAWAESALNSRNAAKASEDAARASELLAQSYKDSANASQLSAKEYRDAADLARASASVSATSAGTSAGVATTQASKAETQANGSQAARAASEGARDIAIQKAAEAAASAAGVGLPAAKGPRWVLALNADGSALSYDRRYPSSVSDTDPSSLLVAGSFGLGGTAVSLGAADINTIQATGHYYVGGASNGPNAAFTGYITHVTITVASRSFQRAVRRTDGFEWIRYQDGAAWSNWEPCYSGLSVPAHIKTLMVSASAASARTALGASQAKRRVLVEEVLWTGTLSGQPFTAPLSRAILTGESIRIGHTNWPYVTVDITAKRGAGHRYYWDANCRDDFVVAADGTSIQFTAWHSSYPPSSIAALYIED